MEHYVVELALSTGSRTTVAIGCRNPADLGVEVQRYCLDRDLHLKHPDSWELKLILDDIMLVPTHSQPLLDIWWQIQKDLESDRVNDLECIACRKSLNLKKGKKSA